MDRKTRYSLLSLILILGFMVLLGCDHFGFTKIKEIADSPFRFEGKEVKVKGVVVDAVRIPFTEVVVYTLMDDSGSITIVGTGAKPSNGDKIRLKGKVSTAIKICTETFGTHISEEKRL